MESAERARAIVDLPAASPRFQLASIDALRAFAAIWVLLHHANLMFWQSPLREHDPRAIVRICYQTFGLGWLGVPLFFVISGFCIHLPYARRGRPNPREYIIRRAVRIWPPFAAAIVAGLIFQLAKGNHAPSLFAHFAANLAFLFPGRGPIRDDNFVFWSIVVEVQLYAIYLLIRTLTPSSRALVGWTIAFVAFGIAYHLAAEIVTLPDALTRVAKPRFFAPARMGEWLMGAILADRLVNRPPPRDRPAFDAAFILAGIATIAAMRAATTSFGFGQDTLEPFASAGFALILAGLVRRERHRPAGAGSRLVASVGHRSYSLYLFHLLAINVALYIASRHVLPPGDPLPGSGRWLAATACGIALAVVAAEFAYRFVERPSHQLSRRLAGRAG